MHISATELKNKLGQYIEASIKEPVVIEKTGRPVTVMISFEQYQKLQEMEDYYWGEMALQNAKEGFLGTKKTQAQLKKLAKKVGLNSARL